MTHPRFDTQPVISALERWAVWADGQRYPHPADPSLACFCPGYVHWGVQSNWNYLATMATLAEQTGVAEPDRWRDRAVSALRYALATHVTGPLHGNDGAQWGHHWISMLGIERAMHGVAHLLPHIDPETRDALRRLLISEANWILYDARRGSHAGVVGGLWAESGKNVPESNIWCGAFLWRIACMYPDEANVPAWIDRAHDYFINGVSIEADAEDDTIVAGKPVRERYAGANFFPNYALDHHGYLNVGYKAISVSNAAMLHFDAKRDGMPRPESLDHHQGDLWDVLRRMVFSDGRLARIGGDSRVRYAYCQEYLLPSLLYAADRFRDPHALTLAQEQVGLMLVEAAENADGSFYSSRVNWLARTNPHYHTRLESDRAVVLAMLLNYLPLVDAPAPADGTFEESVAGGWIEPDHGAALTRSPERFASFSWRAQTLGQALCLPPDRSDLAEWSRNLCPVVRFLGDGDAESKAHRRLIAYTISSFDGGFVTCGSIMEGVNVRIDEGGSCTDQAVTDIAFAALPDGHTCVVLQRVTTAPDRTVLVTEMKGLHLNVPNDVFNNHRRTIATESGTLDLTSPAARDETVPVSGSWLNVDGVLGVSMLYGGDGLAIDRAVESRGGRYQSLIVDEVCSGIRRGPERAGPAETLVDLGCAILANASTDATARSTGERMPVDEPDVRGVTVAGLDGQTYGVVANFGANEAALDLFGQAVRIPGGTAIIATEDGGVVV